VFCVLYLLKNVLPRFFQTSLILNSGIGEEKTNVTFP
jgi:hypothetical protein